MTKQQALPIGWGDDTLTRFQANAILNEYATFAHEVEWQAMLGALAADLDKCTRYAISTITSVEDPSALLLFATAHNQFLGSVRLVTAGQCLVAYPTGRATIESALYGWYLSRGTDIAKRWHNKPDASDKEKQRAWNNEFKFSSLCKELSSVTSYEAKWARHLHQNSIDMGAHPNRDALYSNMSSRPSGDGGEIIEMQFLHPWGLTSIAAMKFVIETGMFVLRLFPLAFPSSEPNLGIKQNAETHVRKLQKLVRETDADALQRYPK